MESVGFNFFFCKQQKINLKECRYLNLRSKINLTGSFAEMDVRKLKKQNKT